MITQHIQRAADNAHIVTFSAGGSAVAIWGLQLGDLGVIVSMFGVLCGVAIQFYTQVYRPWRDRVVALEKQQAITQAVVVANAVAQRTAVVKSAENTDRIAALESDTKS